MTSLYDATAGYPEDGDVGDAEVDDAGYRQDRDVNRRSLLRIGLSAAVGVTAAAPATAPGAAAARRLSATTAHGPAPNTRFQVMAGPSSSPSGAPIRTNPTARPWAGPAYHVRDVLPDAPANAIALTIDDGPHPTYTPMMLDVLRQYNVKATFSMIGTNVQGYPEVARQVVAEGHTISNHSMYHPIPFNSLSPTAIHAEVANAMNQIWDATKKIPRLFRAPGGAWSPAVFAAIAAYDLVPIDWDVDPRDWTVPGIKQIENILDTGVGGDILLCHDGGGNRLETVRAVNQVIPALLKRKLEFVTL
ncbi:MAG: polysaccharide deacetylase family protein [Actinobacteria bacterium]|nr:polysaccharide deacetylase family protein [Actinomycetota bacterium]MBO0835084.1 polysaccharide deacetylase family protein [Actinomycetota bacterium]